MPSRVRTLGMVATCPFKNGEGELNPGRDGIDPRRERAVGELF